MMFCTIMSYGQNQANKWFFGHGVGLDFSSGSPVEILGGQVNVHGGSASVCDSISGELLFYTDGLSVWNVNHQTMPNGLNLQGSNTTTQSALIVPYPGNPEKYFIFTADQAGYNGTNQGIHYSIVNMTLDNGLGDLTVINTPLLSPATENIIVIRHCNMQDFWIIVHEQGNDAFYTYPLTSAGIGFPVISNIGTPNNNVSGLFMESVGWMKASPDGRRIANVSHNTLNNVEVFDFDKSNGLINNPITIPIPFSPNNPNVSFGPYGVSFSPNNDILYVSLTDYIQDKIFQFDLLAGTPSQMISSATEFDISGFSGVDALQNAPDGKIYVAFVVPIPPYIGVINNPNSLGDSCDFVEQGFTLSSNTPCYSFPNFIEDIFNDPTSVVEACPDDNVQIDAGAGFIYNWSTGETSQIINVFNDGVYSVEILSEGGCTLYDTTIVHFNEINLSLIEDTSICEGHILLDAYQEGANYLWTNGDTTSSIFVSEPGEYGVDVFVNGCVHSDKVLIENSCSSTVYVPNSFTPNGDGMNEVFLPITNSISCYSLTIYNRWGEIIFESYNAAIGWDGSYAEGGLAPDGIYIWQIEFDLLSCDKQMIERGHFKLLK